ncbi:hypothetical protein PVIIG_05388 [Plasmodium vivax India VII]|uniref:Variable surface protein Vir18 n=1 Tax=Plasmodium vivax India VII TaxID=1077284 RepID=A0A0J9S404_PLAVI|nr:hypothetical protein PVIIG_05388 [Plasmodium vivax India VII]
MGWPFGRSDRLRNLYNRHNDAPCMNNYTNIKREIIQKIEDLDKTTHGNFYQQWADLNKYIIEKDKELSECYKKGYVNSKLNDDDTIKNFKSRCNRDRTCNNRATAATKPTITKVPAQRTCKGCNNESPPTVDIKSKSKFSSGAANPQSSERDVSQEQGQNPADGQKPRQESVVSQSQPITMPSESSVGTHDKASQKIVNHQPATSGVAEAQEQQLNASAHSGISKLGSPPSDHSSQRISEEISDLTFTTTGKNLVEKGIQTNEHSRNLLDTKHSASQDSVSKIVAGGTGDDKDSIRETSHNVSPIVSTPGSVQHVDENLLPTANDSGSHSSLSSDPKNTVSEEISSAAHASTTSSDAGAKGITDVDISTSVGAPDGEGKIVKDCHDYPHGSEGSCIGTTYGTSQKAEITSDNNNDILGTLSHVFEVIQENKDNMIKASAPMGIALLLGLLFKVN